MLIEYSGYLKPSETENDIVLVRHSNFDEEECHWRKRKDHMEICLNNQFKKNSFKSQHETTNMLVL